MHRGYRSVSYLFFFAEALTVLQCVIRGDHNSAAPT